MHKKACKALWDSRLDTRMTRIKVICNDIANIAECFGNDDFDKKVIILKTLHQTIENLIAIPTNIKSKKQLEGVRLRIPGMIWENVPELQDEKVWLVAFEGKIEPYVREYTKNSIHKQPLVNYVELCKTLEKRIIDLWKTLKDPI